MPDYELLQALTLVRRDAQAQLEKAQLALSKPPLFGWSQEKHDSYFLRAIAEARAVEKFCLVRTMQIDPD